MEMDAKNLRKLAKMLEGLSSEYMTKHGIQWFFIDEAWLCFQLLDKSKHVMVKIDMRDFSGNARAAYVLVPKDFAIKALVLGSLP